MVMEFLYIQYHLLLIAILLFVHTGAVRRNFPQQSNNLTEIVVKDWLRYAKDRDGGRQKPQEDRQDDSDD
ncbi:hypothetical protein DPMN_137794 [Dreissena polymorpha]|uniref:Uncharacterized protein n=1 Tax=Dreissena polymorpha TaxID=45954 RepID=A0A9D4G2I5_DREPO|nr:hypothetical protein DPMN_137794 [Dreissena polymorpha]